MPLVNMKALLSDAQKGGYAVGSFSVANLEMILGIIKVHINNIIQAGNFAAIQIVFGNRYIGF